MNKQIKHFYNQIISNNYYSSLEKCYNKPSWNKINAYRNCIKRVWEKNEKIIGSGILSYNTFKFTMFTETEQNYYIDTPAHAYKIDKVTLKVTKLF